MAARRAASAFNAELLALALRGLAPQPKAAPAPTAEPAKEPIILWGILFFCGAILGTNGASI
jgi:hypothetical protein